MIVRSLNRKLTLITIRPDTIPGRFCNILNVCKNDKLLTKSNCGAWVINESKYVNVKLNWVKRILFMYYI